jgi:secretion/DNA translocation related TadE-like protein
MTRSHPARFGAAFGRGGDHFLHRNERGAVTVLAIALLALAVALAFGVARLGHATGERARAETAADAAALAAAGALARGQGTPAALVAANETAASNGARLVRCACAGSKPFVEVSIGAATGRARAEVRFDCFADPAGC